MSTGGITLHPHTGRPRLVGPDVTRALALIGVVIMNYHGFLNTYHGHAAPGAGFAERLFDPWTGVLSTRFAATFVFVAGVGVTLLTNTSRLSGQAAAISADRWRLVRRGLLLYGVGLVFNWIWEGTILPYYGAMFVLASVLFALRIRWVAAIGVTATAASVAIQWWAIDRSNAGNYPGWLLSPDTFANRSPRGLVYDIFVNGSHPLLPWLAFFTAGIIAGRYLPRLASLGLAACGAALTGATYAINHWVTPGEASGPLRNAVLSTQPYSRSLLYVLCTLGSSFAVFCLVSFIAQRTSSTLLVRTLQLAGQTTLSLYVGHVVFYKAVDALDLVRPTGLDTALVLSLTYWVLAVIAAALWQRRYGIGPCEWWYRRFGG